MENRARLLLEVVDAVTEVWSVKRVGVRISRAKPFNGMYESDPDKTFGCVVERLGALKLAYLHVVKTDQSVVSTRQVVDFRRLSDLFSMAVVRLPAMTKD